MKLTTQEQVEKEALEVLKCSLNPMLRKTQDRLEYLENKRMHNCCINPKCFGYEGTEDDIFCPKCDKNIFKMPLVDNGYSYAQLGN